MPIMIDLPGLAQKAQGIKANRLALALQQNKLDNLPVQQAQQNRLAELTLGQKQAEVDAFPQQHERAAQEFQLQQMLKSAQLNNALNPPAVQQKFGQPVAGVDPKGNPIFKRFSPTGESQLVEGLTPRPKVPLVQFGNDAPLPEETAKETGVPVAKSRPWDRISDPKVRENAIAKHSEAAEKRLQKGSDTLKPLQAMKSDLQRFQFLNESNFTGRSTAIPGIQGTRAAFDPEFDEMDSIASRIVPKMREPGSGTTSDFDAKMFKQATIGVNKSLEANNAIISASLAHIQRQEEKQQFMEEYVAQNGHMGADAQIQWRRYMNANPLFDPSSKPGSLKLNENRIPYKQYFSGQSGIESLLNKYGVK